MKRYLIATTLALLAAAPAMANDQLAMSLGFEPGKYTTSELAALSLADGRDDRWLKREILSDGADIISTQSPMAGYPGGMNPGKVQLARGLGLDPADYTTAELARKFLSEYGTTN